MFAYGIPCELTSNSISTAYTEVHAGVATTRITLLGWFCPRRSEGTKYRINEVYFFTQTYRFTAFRAVKLCDCCVRSRF